MKQTENYQLSQWEKADRIQMEDFNGDNSKVDAALAGLAATMAEHGAALSQHAGAIAKLGNCAVEVTGYTGSGSVSRSVTFSKPVMAMLVSGGGRMLFALYGDSKAYAMAPNGFAAVSASVSGNTVSWSGSSGDSAYFVLNESGTTYRVVGLLSAG